jgi:hypothetical protein
VELVQWLALTGCPVTGQVLVIVLVALLLLNALALDLSHLPLTHLPLMITRLHHLHHHPF